MTAAPILEMRKITKVFPGVRALSDVDLTLHAGRVTALIGENGAGKSTLVKTITGLYRPDGGEILIDGRATVFATAAAAEASGITAIHQETVLFDELSVAENIYLGHTPKTRLGLVDWAAVNARAAAILYSLDAPFGARTRLKDLSIGQRHLVAVARALSIDARVVVMDEPTAALSQKETEELFQIIARLKAQGTAILFISHKFAEVFSVADDYVVFRDGQSVGAGAMDTVDQNELVRLMVGRAVDDAFPKINVALGETVLEVEDYCHPTEFDGIDLTLRKGEILGLYGLVGAGRSEFCQSLFGVTRPSRGTVRIDGRAVAIRRPGQAIEAGLVYVPEERGRHGVVLAMPIFENISLASLGAVSRRGFIRSAEEFAQARLYAERLDLRAASLSQPVGTLSGGNQQKVVIGKWLATKPKIIILDEPTKGIDIGSKAAVHAFIGELAALGLAVIMISSELPEILGMSDRVTVFREGRQIATYDRENLDAETLVRAATGNVLSAEANAYPIAHREAAS